MTDIMCVSSFHPVASWAEVFDEAHLATKMRQRPPQVLPIPALEEDDIPVGRPVAGWAAASGALGPGAYMYSERLCRRSSSVPSFGKGQRFKDPMLETKSAASTSISVGAAIDAEVDWGPRQAGRAPPNCGIRSVRPLRHPRVVVGRAASGPHQQLLLEDGGHCSLYWPPKSHMTTCSLDPDGTMSPKADVRDIRKKCLPLPLGMHPRNRGHIEASQATLEAAAARDEAAIQLFASKAPIKSRQGSVAVVRKLVV